MRGKQAGPAGSRGGGGRTAKEGINQEVFLSRTQRETHTKTPVP